MSESETSKSSAEEPMRPIPSGAIWLGFLVILLIGCASIIVLIWNFGSGTAQDRIRLESIKLAGSIAVGTGGIGALLLAARRQRATELGLNEQAKDQRVKEQAQILEEKKAADTLYDAEERRATDLYARAAEQLGSDKAAVRMAGLYALERLGHVSPKHRQTVTNLFCAYLRMPFAHPIDLHESLPRNTGAPPKKDSTPHNTILLDLTPRLATATGISQEDTKPQEELQVRRTVQELLNSHLDTQKRDRSATNDQFRREASDYLSLSGAVLDNFELRGPAIDHADFTGAEFYGNARFRNMAVNYATFKGATFHDSVNYYEVDFLGDAIFTGAKFKKYPAGFHNVTFHRFVKFNHIDGDVTFNAVSAHNVETQRKVSILPPGWRIETDESNPADSPGRLVKSRTQETGIHRSERKQPE